MKQRHQFPKKYVGQIMCAAKSEATPMPICEALVGFRPHSATKSGTVPHGD
jgi:hypothetical protein